MMLMALHFVPDVVMSDGESLTLNKIGRTESGAYLCIASNGVPPSVSKRIWVDVECEWRSFVFETVILIVDFSLVTETFNLFIWQFLQTFGFQLKLSDCH